jgi:hypothetical protein
MERALIVRQPWIDLILSGKKTWEMRSRPTNVRGKIGLIEQGSGLIVGECKIVDSDHIKLDPIEHGLHYSHHRVDDFNLLNKWCYAWEIEGAKRYDKPIPYQHPQCAVTWVRIAHYPWL